MRMRHALNLLSVYPPGAASKRCSSAFLLILPIAFLGISATRRISVGSLYLVRVRFRDRVGARFRVRVRVRLA